MYIEIICFIRKTLEIFSQLHPKSFFNDLLPGEKLEISNDTKICENLLNGYIYISNCNSINHLVSNFLSITNISSFLNCK